MNVILLLAVLKFYFSILVLIIMGIPLYVMFMILRFNKIKSFNDFLFYTCEFKDRIKSIIYEQKNILNECYHKIYVRKCR